MNLHDAAPKLTGGYEGSLIMSPHLAIARFPARDLAASDYVAFVCNSFHMSMRRPVLYLWNELKRPGARMLVAMPAEGERVYLGWLACMPTENRIICAFTKAAYRASPEQRGGREENADAFRIASSLAIAGGISFDRQVNCSFWSRAARAIAEKPGNPYSLRFNGDKR